MVQATGATLAPLIDRLRNACGMQLASDVPLASAVAAGDWRVVLAESAERSGLAVRWWSGSARDAVELARPDLPVVGVAQSETGEPIWYMLDGFRWGYVRVHQVGAVSWSRWVRADAIPEELQDLRHWALVEPAFPAELLRGDQASGAKPFRRLLGLLRMERDDLLMILVYAITLGLLSLATPLAMQVLINWLAFGALLQPVASVGLALFVFLTLAAVLRVAQRMAVEVLERRVFARLAADLAGRLRRVDVRSLDDADGAEHFNRFFDVLTVQKAMRSLVLDGLAALLQAGVGLAVLALYHPVLFIFDIVLVVSVAAVWVVPGWAAARTAVKESKHKYKVQHWMEEMARQPRLFKLANAGVGEHKADQLTRAYLQARSAHFTVFLRQYIGMQGVQVLVSAALLVICGWLVLEGELTLGQLVAAEFIVTAALTGLAKFTDKLDTYYDLLAALDKIGHLVDLPTERNDGVLPRKFEGAVELEVENASYRFPGLPPLLTNISFKVPARSRVLIVGESGTGKSVLADLLVGVRAPVDGSVLRDGWRLDTLHAEAAYRDVALLRGVELFTGTLLDNLLLGRPGRTAEDVWQALKVVGLDGVIAELPQGIHTEVLQSGAPLSQAQCRALMVARALVGEPRLVVVDALFDGISEQEQNRLLTALDQRSGHSTLVVLSNDAELDRHFQTVYELTDGGLRARTRIARV